MKSKEKKKDLHHHIVNGKCIRCGKSFKESLCNECNHLREEVKKVILMFQLAIINNGRLHSFDLRLEDYIRWLATPEDEVVTKDLEEEVKMLREQYLEIEEKLKELGRTTKRVQTFVSKLKK